MVVTFKSVAVRDASCLLESDATTSVSAHAVLILNGHDSLTEIALIHVKVEAIHGNKLGERDVVSLTSLIRQCIAKNKHSLFRCVRMEVYKDVERVELVGILADCLFGGPNCRLQSFTRIDVEPIQILTETIKSIVTS